jgi:hypothetical protein
MQVYHLGNTTNKQFKTISKYDNKQVLNESTLVNVDNENYTRKQRKAAK